MLRAGKSVPLGEGCSPQCLAPASRSLLCSPHWLGWWGEKTSSVHPNTRSIKPQKATRRSERSKPSPRKRRGLCTSRRGRLAPLPTAPAPARGALCMLTAIRMVFFLPQRSTAGYGCASPQGLWWVIKSSWSPFPPRRGGQDSRDRVEIRNKGLRAKEI